MGFTLKDILSRSGVKQLEETKAAVEVICPSGKQTYMMKSEARHIALQMNRKNLGRAMKAYRCDWCEHFHVGHSRGRHD